MSPPTGSGSIALLSTPLQRVPQEGLGASEYLAEVHGIENGCPTPPNVAGEKALCRLLVDAVKNGWILAAHDVSEGGFAVAAAEMAIAGTSGIRISAASLAFSTRGDAVLFGEFPGRVLVCFDGESHALEAAAKKAGLQFHLIGEYGSGDELIIEPYIRTSVKELKHIYDEALPSIMREVIG